MNTIVTVGSQLLNTFLSGPLCVNVFKLSVNNYQSIMVRIFNLGHDDTSSTVASLGTVFAHPGAVNQWPEEWGVSNVLNARSL